MSIHNPVQTVVFAALDWLNATPTRRRLFAIVVPAVLLAAARAHDRTAALLVLAGLLTGAAVCVIFTVEGLDQDEESPTDAR